MVLNAEKFKLRKVEFVHLPGMRLPKATERRLVEYASKPHRYAFSYLCLTLLYAMLYEQADIIVSMRFT